MKVKRYYVGLTLCEMITIWTEARTLLLLLLLLLFRTAVIIFLSGVSAQRHLSSSTKSKLLQP